MSAGPRTVVLPRVRWWITAVVAVGLVLLTLLTSPVLVVLWFVVVPLALLVVAGAVTVCLVLSPRRPDARAVGLGFVVAVPLGVLALAAVYAALLAQV